jgi:hypothetical protein
VYGGQKNEEINKNKIQHTRLDVILTPVIPPTWEVEILGRTVV